MHDLTFVLSIDVKADVADVALVRRFVSLACP